MLFRANPHLTLRARPKTHDARDPKMLCLSFQVLIITPTIHNQGIVFLLAVIGNYMPAYAVTLTREPRHVIRDHMLTLASPHPHYPHQPSFYALYRLISAHPSCMGCAYPRTGRFESVNSWREDSGEPERASWAVIPPVSKGGAETGTQR